MGIPVTYTDDDVVRLYTEDSLGVETIARMLNLRSPYFAKKILLNNGVYGQDFEIDYSKIPTNTSYGKRSKSTHKNSVMICLRLSKHLTQKQVADRANMDYSYYAHIENGTCNPSIRSYKAIAVALGVRNWRTLIPIQ